jgi:DNA (cytosine-5)-methyltransferase 1
VQTLFGRGFEREGFCVVRAAELELGFDAREFSPIRYRFDGIIAGTPCQDFSLARFAPPDYDGYSAEMLREFCRIVFEGQPDWFLLENVPTVPDIHVEGYFIQRFDLNAKECGLNQNRHRHFQFGTNSGKILMIEREKPISANLERTCTASEGNKANRRTFADFCELQGVDRNFNPSWFSRSIKYRIVGNGVPIPMAARIAQAIKRSYGEIDESEPPTNHTAN